MSDGKAMGVFEPGPEVSGVEATGWIDILTGITAHKRQNGEYLVFVEDDYRAKAIMYRWCPSGDCVQPDTKAKNKAVPTKKGPLGFGRGSDGINWFTLTGRKLLPQSDPCRHMKGAMVIRMQEDSRMELQLPVL
jgi:hypothetical protein